MSVVEVRGGLAVLEGSQLRAKITGGGERGIKVEQGLRMGWGHRERHENPDVVFWGSG